MSRKIRSVKSARLISSVKRIDVRNAIKSVYDVRTCKVVHKDDGWRVKGSDPALITKKFRTKVEAVNYAKKICKNKNNDIIVYRKDGSIQKSSRHGFELD